MAETKPTKKSASTAKKSTGAASKPGGTRSTTATNKATSPRTGTAKTGSKAKKSPASNTKKSPAGNAKKHPAVGTGAKKNTGGNAARSSGGQNRGNSDRSAGKNRPVTQKPVRGKKTSRFMSTYMPYVLAVIAFIFLVCFVANQFAPEDVVPAEHPMGWFGYSICHALFGLLGWVAYLIPAVLVVLVVCWKRYVRAGRINSRLIYALLLLLLLSSFTHAIVCASNEDMIGMLKLPALFETGITFTGGGVIGGLLGCLLYWAIRLPGTIVLTVITLPLLIMALVGVTPRDMYVKMREKTLDMRDLQAERRLQRTEARRLNQEAAIDEEDDAYDDDDSYDSDDGYDSDDNYDEDSEEGDSSYDGYEDDPVATAPRGRSSRKDRGHADPASSAEDQDESTAEAANTGRRASQKRRNENGRRAVLVDTETGEVLGEGATLSAEENDNSVRPAPETDEDTDPTASGHAEAVAASAAPKASKGKPSRRHADDRADADPVTVTSSEAQGASSDAEEDDVAPPWNEPSDEGSEASDKTQKTAPSDTVLQTDPRATEDAETDETYEDDTDENGDDDIIEYTQVDLDKNSVTDLYAETNAEDLPEDDPLDGQDPAEETADGTADRAVGDASDETVEEPVREYIFPTVDMLSRGPDQYSSNDEEIAENTQILREVLQSFRIGVREITCSCGPTITRFEVKPDTGVRVRSIANLVDDIAMGLAKAGVRIEAPIPGKNAVGIEVPNAEADTVYLRNILETPEFRNHKSRISACLGADVAGRPVILDIHKMPHLLIAGATGTGKSVCINSLIMSILFKAKPDEVKLILIDPKKVEFAMYRGLPHLYAPVVSDPKKAAGALNSAVNEMERRFELIEEVGVRNIAGYNEITAGDPERPPLPQMVIIIDELADLMMTAPAEVETAICRLAQKARAAGIHLIIGTQRPSVDVITGLIKANVPSRIAFTVKSGVDSRTILDTVGAEKLIGRGDMLYAPIGSTKPIRAQGAFVSEAEVEKVVTFIKENNEGPQYDEEFARSIVLEAAKCGNKKKGGNGGGEQTSMSEDDFDSLGGGNYPDGEDPKFWEALEIVITKDKIGTSALQRGCNLGYGRAAKIIDRMEELGFIGPDPGTKQGRKVLITKQEFIQYKTYGLPGTAPEEDTYEDDDGDCED